MTKGKGKLFIGTSGWVYSHWKNVFYPANLAQKDKLKYFSRHFQTVEINYSFYHLPDTNTFQKWRKETPTDFIFAVKISRYITHIKRLKKVKDACKTFLENASELKEKLGPILFQFPQNFKADNENIERLKFFLSYFHTLNSKCRYALEFRHQSWFTDEIYKILKKHNAAFVIADSPDYPKTEIITANFVYIRMHGSKILFSSNYTEQELKDISQKIKKWQSKKLDVYIYFNNDAEGYAIKNAKTLIKFKKNLD